MYIKDHRGALSLQLNAVLNTCALASLIHVLVQVLLFIHQWQAAPFGLLPWPNHPTLTRVKGYIDLNFML